MGLRGVARNRAALHGHSAERVASIPCVNGGRRTDRAVTRRPDACYSVAVPSMGRSGVARLKPHAERVVANPGNGTERRLGFG